MVAGCLCFSLIPVCAFLLPEVFMPLIAGIAMIAMPVALYLALLAEEPWQLKIWL